MFPTHHDETTTYSMPNHRHPSRYGVPFTGLPLFEEAIFGIYISPESCELASRYSPIPRAR